MILLPIISTSLGHLFLRSWENVLFELESERVKRKGPRDSVLWDKRSSQPAVLFIAVLPSRKFHLHAFEGAKYSAVLYSEASVHYPVNNWIDRRTERNQANIQEVHWSGQCEHSSKRFREFDGNDRDPAKCESHDDCEECGGDVDFFHTQPGAVSYTCVTCRRFASGVGACGGKPPAVSLHL